MPRLAFLLLILIALAVPAGAVAFTTSGDGSPDGRVVTYFSAVPQHEWAVGQAVRAWNRSGADVEFVEAPRREAELIIEGGAGAMDGHAETVFRGTGPRPGDSRVRLPSPSVARGRDARFHVALIATHELGHVLKLGHEDAGCATMNSTIVNSAPARCPQPPAGKWRCGLLEKDDIRGAVSLYGGRPRPPGRKFCPKVPPKPKPPPPSAPEALASAGPVAVSSDAARSSVATVRWLNSDDEDIDAAVVSRAPGRCPRRPSDGEAKTVRVPPGTESSTTFPLELAETCYAVWSRARSGALSRRPATAWLDPPQGPEPPHEFTAEPALGHPLGTTGVSLGWRNGDTPALSSVVLARERGRCPRHPPRPVAPWNTPPARPRTYQRHVDLAFQPVSDPERVCYVAWSRDRFGRLSRPVSVRPQRPVEEDGAIVLAE